MRFLTILISVLYFNVNLFSQLYYPPTNSSSWDTLSPQSLNWCVTNVDSLYDYLDETNSKAFILLKNGKIVFEKYFGTFSQDSAWYWASAGKSLTGFLVGIAEEENYLSIDDTTSTFLGNGWTSCLSQQEEKITIKHQLSMSTGLDDSILSLDCTLPSCLNYLTDPGNRWAYHNGPYTLLDDVIESATGLTLNAYMNSRVETITGITGVFLPIGSNNVYFSKPRSMARFGLLINANGQWDGNSILGNSAYFNDMLSSSQTINKAYGYLWWLNGKTSYQLPQSQFQFPGPLLPDAPNETICALGKNGQYINIVPSKNLVWIRMGDSPDTSNLLVANSYNNEIWKRINGVLCETSQIPDNTIEQITIYPNPIKNNLAISLKQKSSYKIYSMSGNIIMNGKLESGENILNLSGLKPGVYIIKTISRNLENTFKIVKSD